MNQKIIKTMHVINLKCDKRTYKIDVTNKSESEINMISKKHFKKGINFIKII